MKISVAIVEDNTDIRYALERIIMCSQEFKLVCSCKNGEDALDTIPDLNPRIVLMDIHLGGINGIDCVRQLKQKNPEMLFMMCTIYEESEKIFEALSAGANGYILKKTAPAKLLDALKELSEGGAPMSSQIARKVVSAFQITKPAASSTDSSLDLLSKREKGILEMLSRGMLYKEISEQLFISVETVRKHVYHIYEKLHVRNRIEAVNVFFGR